MTPSCLSVLLWCRYQILTNFCYQFVPGGSPQKGSVTRKMFPFDDVIMNSCYEVDHTFQSVITSHRMMTSSNGNLLRVTGHLSGEFTGPGELPTQRPVTRSFDVFFDLRLNKWLSKQWWGWWFEMLSCPLRRHCNGMYGFFIWFECPITEPDIVK